MQVTLVEGKKLNSFNYLSEGFMYVKVRTSQQFTYGRCALNRSFGCPGYAKIDNVTNTLITTSAHDHGEEAYKRGEYSLRNKLKRAELLLRNCVKFLTKPVEKTRRPKTPNMISFQQIESSMCKRRRCLFPPLPKDAEDFSKLIVASPFTHLHRGTVNHDGAVAVI